MMTFQKQPYLKRLKLRLLTLSLLFVLGIVSVCLSAGLLPVPLSSHMVGFYAGCGGGLLGASIVTLFRTIRLLRDPSRRAEEERKENDERNVYIVNRTAYLTFWIMVFLLYIALLVAGIFSELIATTLLAILGVGLVTWFIIYIICKKIY